MKSHKSPPSHNFYSCYPTVALQTHSLMKTPLLSTTLACLALSFSIAFAEPQAPPAKAAPRPLTPQEEKVAEGLRRAAIENKLKQIILPSIQFEDITVEEAVDFLRVRSVELDVTEKDPAKKGVNFVIIGGKAKNGMEEPSKRVIKNLQLKNIPLEVAIRYICELTNLKSSIDAYSVTIRP